MRGNRRRQGGFTLLEVIISLMILGISVAALMRSFTVSMRAVSKNGIITQACVLAETKVQEFELSAPASAKSSGTFEEEGFPKYSWTAEYKEEEIKYKNLKTKSKIRDLRPLRRLTVSVTYDDGRIKSFTPVELDVYLPPVERFSYNSKFLNELFLDEDSKR